jgi:nitrogen fixation/metabolism regulation signal transduction histidine kinase
MMARIWRYLLAAGGLAISILLFLLASAASNTEFFGQDYNWLLAAAAIVALALLVVVAVLLLRLYQRYKKGRFGSRLTARLVTLFAIMGLLPCIVIYLVSFQFVSRSIESWFDVRIESALDSGLVLGRSALDSSLSSLKTKADSIAAELAGLPESGQTTTLARALNQYGLQEALIVTEHRRLIATAGKAPTLAPELPTAEVLHTARMPGAYAQVEGGDDTAGATPRAERAARRDAAGEAAELRLRVVVPIPRPGSLTSLQTDAHFLQLVQAVDRDLAVNAEALRVASSEYQTRSVARSGLRKIYIGALT